MYHSCVHYAYAACCSGGALKIQPAPPGMPFGVHIDVITSMANLEVFFFVPQVPPAPRCTPVVISTKPTSRLSLAPCCACQPSFGHIQAAPRRALAPVESSPGLAIWPVSGTKSMPVWPVWDKSFRSTNQIEEDNIHRVAPRHRQLIPFAPIQ